MSAPSHQSLPTPSGNFLTEGFSHRITFARNPSIALWAKKSTPPGFDSGGKIDITNQHLTKYRTAVEAALIDVTDVTVTVAYDPRVFTDLPSDLMGRGSNGAITYHMMDGSKVSFYGYVDKFAPSETSDKNQPEAQVTICVTNWDPVERTEQGPVVSSVSGT